MQYRPMTESPSRKRGCWLYGCVGAILLVLILGVLVIVGYRYALKGLVGAYTDSAPAPIERVEIPAPQLSDLQQRVAAFTTALEKQDVSRELSLSADDINALIASTPAFQYWKDKLHVLIEGDRLKGQVSMPLKDIGLLKLNSRYLNGMASFKVSLDNGRLQVKLEEVAVKGRPLPGPVITEIKKQNLADNFQGDPETAARIEKFESIRVQDGKLILKSRAKP